MDIDKNEELQQTNQIALKPKGFGNWIKSHYTPTSAAFGIVLGLGMGAALGSTAVEAGFGGLEALAIGAAGFALPKLFEGAAHLIEHVGGKLWSRKSSKGEKTKDYQIGGSVAVKSVRNAIVTGGLAALGTELVAILNPEFVLSKVATLPFLTLPATCVATVTLVGSAIYFAKNMPTPEQMRLDVPRKSNTQMALREGKNLNTCSGKLLWELTKTTAQGLILTAGAGVTLFFASRQAADQWVSNQQNPTPEMMKLVQFTANAFAVILTEGVFILVQRRDFELDWRRTAQNVPVLGDKNTGDEYTGDLAPQNNDFQNIN